MNLHDTLACIQFIGSVGVILRIDDDGDLLVNYESNANFNVNSAAVKRVRISSDFEPYSVQVTYEYYKVNSQNPAAY